MTFTTIHPDEVCTDLEILDVSLFGNNPKMARKIVEITYRGIDRFGKKFVMGYHTTGTETGKCSFTYHEDEKHYLISSPTPKSKGHIGFTENFEYFVSGDDVFRAQISDVMDVWGHRAGARFESTLAGWESLGHKLVTFI